jgi:predicted component of type VI protein secretion system
MTHKLEGSIGTEALSWELADGRHRIGRGPGNQIVLHHGTVSREHAELMIDGAKLEIEDLGSRNGTYVDGRKIDGKSSIEVGSLLRFGSVDLLLSSDEAPTARRSRRNSHAARSTGPSSSNGTRLASRRVSWDDVQSEIDTDPISKAVFRVS